MSGASYMGRRVPRRRVRTSVQAPIRPPINLRCSPCYAGKAGRADLLQRQLQRGLQYVRKVARRELALCATTKPVCGTIGHSAAKAIELGGAAQTSRSAPARAANLPKTS